MTMPRITHPISTRKRTFRQRADECLVAAYTTGLTKIYDPAGRAALDNVNVAFRAGELCALMGPSGSGKSTLLACLAGHEPPSVGRVYVGRGDARPWLPQQVRQICRGEVGFALSHSRPFLDRTVEENLEWAAALAGTPPTVARARTDRIAAVTGLLDDLGVPVGLLPEDRRHLTMCAAALLPGPSVLLVDETEAGGAMTADTFAVLRRCATEFGTTVVAVTDDPAAAALADRVLFLSCGRVAGIVARPAEDVVHELREVFATQQAEETEKAGRARAGKAGVARSVPDVAGPPRAPAPPAQGPAPGQRVQRQARREPRIPGMRNPAEA
jgi:putative ABC transport system ATP-binding protein